MLQRDLVSGHRFRHSVTSACMYIVHVHTIISYLPALINIKSLPKIELCYNDLIGYAYFYYHHETVLVGGQDDDICKNVNN